MKINKPLFASSIIVFLMLLSVLIASFTVEVYRMNWPHTAAFAIALTWYGIELHRETK
jgi:hypothetical protein